MSEEADVGMIWGVSIAQFASIVSGASRSKQLSIGPGIVAIVLALDQFVFLTFRCLCGSNALLLSSMEALV